MTAPIAYRRPGVYVEWFDTNPQRLEVSRTDVAGFVGIAERGPVQRATKIESNQQFLSTFGDRLEQAYLAYAVAGFFENGGHTCWVVRVADPADAKRARVRLLLPGRAPFVLEATSPGAWGNALTVEAIWGRDRISHVVVHAPAPDGRTQVIEPDSPREDSAGDRVRTNLLGINDDLLPDLNRDQLARVVADDPWVPLQVFDARSSEAAFAGGTDGLSSLTVDHFAGRTDDNDRPAEERWGVAALSTIDGVSFVAVPDLMVGRELSARELEFGGFGDDALQEAHARIISHCTQRGDRMAILDLPLGRRDLASRYKNSLPRTSFAAVYHPWLIVKDPLRIRRNVRQIPPSGHVAGMYARTDRRRGVHKPPGNEVLEGVCAVSEQLDDEAHGDLNENAINAIRAIPGRGIRVLGVRTLDPDVRWRYVNVRRLFCMIEEAIDEQMQWVTFEPNNQRLWREIDRAVRGFLERLFRLGMLDGENTDQAFLVRCDASTNPEWETGHGRVTCVIGLQPPYPAEFVVVRIGITRNGIQVEERGAVDV